MNLLKAFKISEISIFEKRISEEEKTKEKVYEAIVSMNNGQTFTIQSKEENLIDRIFKEILDEKERFIIIGDNNLIVEDTEESTDGKK